MENTIASNVPSNIEMLRAAAFRVIGRMDAKVRSSCYVHEPAPMDYGHVQVMAFNLIMDQRIFLIMQTETSIVLHRLRSKFQWGVHTFKTVPVLSAASATKRMNEMIRVINEWDESNPPMYEGERLNSAAVFGKFHNHLTIQTRKTEPAMVDFGRTASHQRKLMKVESKPGEDFFYLNYNGVRYRVFEDDTVSGLYIAAKRDPDDVGRRPNKPLWMTEVAAICTTQCLDVAVQSLLVSLRLDRTLCQPNPKLLSLDIDVPEQEKKEVEPPKKSVDHLLLMRGMMKSREAALGKNGGFVQVVFSRGEERMFHFTMDGRVYKVREIPNGLQLWCCDPIDQLVEQSMHADWQPGNGVNEGQMLEARTDGLIEALDTFHERLPARIDAFTVLKAVHGKILRAATDRELGECLVGAEVDTEGTLPYFNVTFRGGTYRLRANGSYVNVSFMRADELDEPVCRSYHVDWQDDEQGVTYRVDHMMRAVLSHHGNLFAPGRVVQPRSGDPADPKRAHAENIRSTGRAATRDGDEGAVMAVEESPKLGWRVWMRLDRNDADHPGAWWPASELTPVS